MRDRGWRRAQQERALLRVKSWMNRNGWFSHDSEEEKAARARRTAITPTPCSCWCCGNPRKWFKSPTMQERRWTDQVVDSLKEYESHLDDQHESSDQADS